MEPTGPDGQESPRARAERWQPHLADPADAPMLRRLALAASPNNAADVRLMLAALSGLAFWAAETGWPVTDETLTDPDLVARYDRVGMPGSGHRFRRRTRRLLDRVGAAHREQALAPPTPGPPERADTKPYTDTDVDALIRWANGQRSDLKRHALLAIISTGLGAGLTTADLLTVHGPDIRTHPDGTVTVHVHGGKPRTVTVLRRYEHLLAGLAAHVRDGWLVAPGPPPASSTGLARQWERAQPNAAGPDLTLRRCAVTWQRDHLRLGTRLDVLAAAAGVGAKGLADQRVPQLAPEPDSQATTRLRTAAHPPEPHQPLPRLPAAYTRNEIDALLAWAAAQPNTQTRDYLLAILAVGLGTGLRAAEHPTTLGTDVTTDPSSGALLLTVHGTAPRTIPCLREHEDLLRAAAHRAGDRPIVQWTPAAGYERRAQRAALPDGRLLPLTAERCRTTWLRAHLASGTRLDTLSRAAGLVTAGTLAALAAGLDPPNDTERRTLLRGP